MVCYTVESCGESIAGKGDRVIWGDGNYKQVVRRKGWATQINREGHSRQKEQQGQRH